MLLSDASTLSPPQLTQTPVQKTRRAKLVDASSTVGSTGSGSGRSGSSSQSSGLPSFWKRANADLLNCKQLPTCKNDHQECRYSTQDFSEKERVNRIKQLFAAWAATPWAKKYKWMYYGGSLLGSARDGEIISWDTDGDIAMTGVDWASLKKEVGNRDAEFGTNGNFILGVECRNADIPGRIIQKDSGFYIDIFVLYSRHTWSAVTQERYKKTHTEPFEQDELFNPYPFGSSCRKFKARDIFPLEPCKLSGVGGFCPKKTVKLLEDCYGPTWKVPKRSQFLF